MTFLPRRWMVPSSGSKRQHRGRVIVVHDQIGGEILNKELDLMLNRLLIERVQHCMAGAVGGGTCPWAMPSP